MKPEHIEIAEQIARDASCAQGEFGQRVLSIIPYLTEVCDRASLVGVERAAGQEWRDTAELERLRLDNQRLLAGLIEIMRLPETWKPEGPIPYSKAMQIAKAAVIPAPPAEPIVADKSQLEAK